ncbi:P-loop containing nucleoside triphosphate hydrolase protein [Aspergillus floccosus]
MTRICYIAVIGVTGAGKTTFISKATGRTNLAIGHSLDSCTKEIEEFRCRVDGTEVVLLDTPGFDDTYDTDADILERIAEYMHASYQSGTLLSGLILLQPINTIRLTNSERTRTRLFKKILGENAYHRVVIGTTMWESLADSGAGNRRRDERMVRDDAWGDMRSRGAKVMDHYNTRESALRILRHILRSSATIRLQMQEELSQNPNVFETSAGRQLDEDLENEITRLKTELAKLRNEKDVTDEELSQLQEQVAKFERKKRSFRRRVVRTLRSCSVM